MKNSKLITLFVLILALMLSLAACGGTDAIEEAVDEAAAEVEEAAAEVEEAVEEVEEVVEEATTEEAAEETTEEVAEETTEEVVEEAPMADYDMDIYGNIGDVDLSGAEVTFWHRYDSGSRQEEIDRLIAEFNATNEYGITVSGDAVGHYGVIYDKMIAGLTTGDVPGLVVAYQNQAAAYQVADGLVSVDPYIADETYGLGDDEADFFASFLASDRLPQFGGQAFGFPAAGRSMEMLFVNMDWLAELGYDAPPQTPEEFAEMACAAAAQPFSKNESGFTTGIEMDTDASVLAAMIFARGGDIFDYENGVFTYDTEESIASAELLQGLFNDGCISEIAEKYGDQTDFGNGKTLFTTSSSSGLPYYGSAVADGEAGGFEWVVAPIPYTGAEPMQNLYGGSVSVVKTDPATQLASWLFLKYWTESENQATWAEASNYFPARASVADNMSDYMAENVAYGAAFDLLPYSKAEAPVAGYDNVRDTVEQAFIDIVFGGADAAATMADLEAEANEIMAESAPDGDYVAPEATEEAAEEAAAPMEYDMDIYGDIEAVDLSGAEVTFWHRYDSGSRQEEIDRLIAEFNATNEYGITVSGDAVGHYGVIYDKMIAGLTTGDVPGLVVAYQNQAAAYQVADGLVSVDPYIASEAHGLGDDAPDYFEAFMASDRLPQFGGQAFGFPAAGRSMEMLFVNMDWLAELGYDAPPQTPEEFAEMACAAAEQPFSKNESDFTTGIEMDTDASVLAAFVFARGGDIFDYENGAFTYNTEEAIASTELLQGLFNDGCISEIAEKYGDQTDFGNGKTLFTTSSSSGLPYYGSAVADGEAGGFEWVVAPIPYTGAEPMQNLYGGSVSVVKTDPATQLASWLFLKYWTESENQATWAEASNYFPARASVADNMSDYMAENVAYGTAFELLPYSKSEAPVAGYDNVRDAVEQAFINIMFGGADATTTLADLELEANEIMAESAP